MLFKAILFAVLATLGYYGGRIYYENHAWIRRFHTTSQRTCADLGLKFMNLGALDVYKERRGHIFLMDMNKPNQNPVKFTIAGDVDLESFNPLGTSVWRSKGTLFLYVVNLRESTAWVEKFSVDLEKVALVHIKSIYNENFHYVNSLLAVGEDQFYFTNYLSMPQNSLLWGHFEMLLRIKWGSVGFYDKGNSAIVADNFLVANGITMSLNGRLVYVANIGEREVRVFTRNTDNSLTEVQVFPLYTAVDNLKTDPATGDIWTAGHPFVHQTFTYLGNPLLPSAGQVLRLKTVDGLITEVTEIYANDGRELSAPTVALPYKGHMLVGAIASSGLICKLNSLQQ